jgi:hypothetical protein
VKRERLDFLADNPHFTKRFAFYVGRRCRQGDVPLSVEMVEAGGARLQD